MTPDGQADAVARAELRRLSHLLGQLPPDERAAVEELARRLADRVTHELVAAALASVEN